MATLAIAACILMGVFGFGLLLIRPVIKYCQRHAIEPNVWLMRMIGGWVLIWVLGTTLFRSRSFDASTMIFILFLLTMVWYALFWYRLKKAPKGDLYGDKIDKIGDRDTD